MSATGTIAISQGDGRKPIETFINLDILGTLGGIGLLVVANALFVRQAAVWIVLPALLVLLAALAIARREAESGQVLRALALITTGNWMVAVVVPLLLPFLWPVMALTVLMPIVLSTPYLNRSQLFGTIMLGSIVVGTVAAIGLLNDDGGAIPDIEDELELLVVVGALIAQIIPIGLIVWQNNRIQQQNLGRATDLNGRLLQSQDELAASRRRVVEAADTERRRIERDLHDGAQQRLVALGVRLRLLESQTRDLPDVHDAVETLVGELDGAVEEVRELAHGIYPPLLQSRGLVDALSAVARRSALPVTPMIDDIGRLDQSTETALYFTAMEALTNAAKHAPDSSVDLALAEKAGILRLTVIDDGPGFKVNSTIRSHGTHNMGDRVAAVGGWLDVSSTLGVGTTVTAVVPRDPADQAITRPTSP